MLSGNGMGNLTKKMLMVGVIGISALAISGCDDKRTDAPVIEQPTFTPAPLTTVKPTDVKTEKASVSDADTQDGYPAPAVVTNQNG